MKMTVEINSVDFTPFILVGKLNWEKNDIDSSSAARTLDGTMRRKRVATKRALSFTCKRMTTEDLQKLCSAIAPEYVSVTYLDPEFGLVTKTFYNSKLTAVTWGVVGDTTYWDGAQFSLVEK